MAEGERDHRHLQPGRQLLGHPGRAALARTQDLEPMALDQWAPAVVPGAVVAKVPAGRLTPYGCDAQWVKNLAAAAGGCSIE